MSENYQIVTDNDLHDDERISAYLRDRACKPRKQEGAQNFSIITLGA